MKKLLGTKSFYKGVFAIMTPILLQNVITNFVSLLDNIMVGQVGTEPMSGVAIANQLFFVFNLCIFGGLSGVGIFTAQYAGKGDEEGIRQTVRIKYFVAVAAVVVFTLIFIFGGGALISAFLHEGSEGLNLASTYAHSLSYMHLMMLQMLPFAIGQIYASTLRECKEPMMPMKASIIAMLMNLVGNYILIFGKFGAPKLGVDGAAIATVIARFAECIILIVYTHKKKDRFPFVCGLLKTLKVPVRLLKEVIKKGIPLLLNEVLWSAGMAMLNQCYSIRGLEVVSATNISSTIFNLFSCVTLASGTTISIIIGQHLGAGKLKQAVEDDNKIIFLSIIIAIVIGGLLAVLSTPLANVYNTTENVRALAIKFILINAMYMPLQAFTNGCYFTLRSGGKTIITFLFDSACTWVCYIPVAFVLAHFTSMTILPIFLIVNGIELVKCIVGFFMLRSKKWVVNLVGKTE